MKIQLKQKKGSTGKTVYHFSGEATIYTVHDLHENLAGILRSSGDLEIDLGGIEKIDTAGFQLFHLMTRDAGSTGRNVNFLNLSEEARRIFDLYCEDHQ